MGKERIPIEIILKVEPILRANLRWISVNQPEKTYYRIKPTDVNSNFFFTLWEDTPPNIDIRNPGNPLWISRSPANETVIPAENFNVDFNALVEHLKNWIYLVKLYISTESVLDDPISGFYYKEYSDKYKLNEDDADYAPFDEARTLIIYNYVDKIKRKAITLKENTHEDERLKELDEIIYDAEQLGSRITSVPKNIVISKLWWMLAKCKKFSFYLANELVKELLVQGIFRALNAGV